MQNDCNLSTFLIDPVIFGPGNCRLIITPPCMTLAGMEVEGEWEDGSLVYGVPVGTDSYVAAMLDLLAPRPPRPPHLPHHLHLQGGTGQGALHDRPHLQGQCLREDWGQEGRHLRRRPAVRGSRGDGWRPCHYRHKQEIMRLLGWCGVASTWEGVVTTEEGVASTGEGVTSTVEVVATTWAGVTYISGVPSP